jgi:hypothetical protein
MIIYVGKKEMKKKRKTNRESRDREDIQMMANIVM